MISERPNLEYNLAGGLLRTITEKDLHTLCEDIVSAGYTHACVLPFRGLMKPGAIEGLQKQLLTIVHLEDAWNPTPYDYFPLAISAGFLGYGKRFLGNKAQPPIIQDALFPSQITCDRLIQALMQTFPATKFISHEIGAKFPPDRLLIEIHDGLKLSPTEILDLTQEKGIGLVFDPRHLLSPERMISFPNAPVKKLRGEWERQFNIFAPNLEVVDINPPQKGDVGELLAGRGLLAEVSRAAKETKEVQFLRVEIPIPISTQLPGSPKQQAGLAFLREISEALRSA